MSEELEWELFEIFESGIFVFPIYEHNSARKIVRYLLMRGILPEEIAEAIEDSTIDLHLWLNRVQGKFMVGEWVIAWMNECREEYEKDLGDEDSSYRYGDSVSREFTPLSHSHTTTTDHDDGAGDNEDVDDIGEGRSDSRITDFESISSQAATASITAERERHFDLDPDLDPFDTKRPLEPSPPPLPPRTLMFRKIRNENGELPKHGRANRPNKLDFFKDSLSLCDGLYMEPPDSGNVSDLYTSIPPEQILGSFVKEHEDNCMMNPQNSDKIKQGEDGLPACPNCTCVFTHYSYLPQTNKSAGEPTIPKHDLINDNHNTGYSDLYIKDTCMLRAMEFTFETLDQDGPGFIFIMTDSSHSTLSWSVEHCYKIASSRQPERCLTEFRSRNIEVDLIWKVKVGHHLQAVSEVHDRLDKYNLHSNWFKCSLSVIMDVVSKTVRQYKL